MTTTRTKLLSAAIAMMLLAPAGQAAGQGINIIPMPQEMTQGQGHFTLTPTTRYAIAGKEGSDVAHMFVDKVKAATGWHLAKGKARDKQGVIVFRISKDIKGAEAYTLSVTPQCVEACASTADGLYYAMQTLLQLLPAAIERQATDNNGISWQIPAVEITDAPRFAYRGVMLDPCRHFLPVNAVKKQIERLSAYKFNHVHWHLTDDQGWRIEIKKYPLLASVGGQRVEGDGSTYGGYYTQDEIREVVAFAKKHHIEIVPEFELPGHEMAAIAAYPWLSCSGQPTTPRIIWGVEDVVLCPGRETTFKFIKDVIDEMVPLFPGKLFHIGGDESPRTEWEHCDSCQARMKQLGYEKEAQLQSYVVGRVGKYLSQKGKRIIGWDEILEGGNLDTTAVVMSWRGEAGGIEAAKMGHHVLMTPSSHGLYFDQYQSDPATEPTAIGGYSTLKKVYGYDPVPQALRERGNGHYVMGVQANCWSEYMLSPATLEYRLWPRALALSEIAWTQPGHKNYDDFIRRVDNDAALRLQAWNLNFHIPAPEQPGGSLNDVAFTDSISLTLTTVRPLKIVYTTDGTQPTLQSPSYTAPLKIKSTTTVRTAAVLPAGIMGPVRTITIKKQDYQPALNVGSERAKGVKLDVYKGTYLSPYSLPLTPTESKTVADLRALRTQTRVPGNVRNVDNYAAIATGYVEMPSDSVYEFSTNNSQLWIDGVLLVDNSGMACPRYSPNNAQVALKKGPHAIKVVFIGGIFAGWPTYWDNAAVRYRCSGGQWKTIDADMLSH